MNNFLQGFFSVMSMKDLGVFLGIMCFLILLVVFVLVAVFVIYKIVENW